MHDDKYNKNMEILALTFYHRLIKGKIQRVEVNSHSPFLIYAIY
jgi:hypothetical protein